MLRSREKLDLGAHNARMSNPTSTIHHFAARMLVQRLLQRNALLLPQKVVAGPLLHEVVQHVQPCACVGCSQKQGVLSVCRGHQYRSRSCPDEQLDRGLGHN
jgi:hypothetical protein